MYESIKNFNEQFSYQPEIINTNRWVKKTSFIIVGMGGSALTAKLLKTCRPDIDLVIHQDYGLPPVNLTHLENKLIILSSYSGNTEEVIDAFNKAKEKKLNFAVIAVGGELLKLAIENNIPYIQLPDASVQPRMALGLSLKAVLKLMGEEKELEKVTELRTKLTPTSYEENGKKLAERIKNFSPVIYASSRNLSLANIWKIKFNETGKIPAFYNAFPELNHNEMTGFDVKEPTQSLSDKLYFILLKDPEDDVRIQKRMDMLEKLYKDRNLKVEILELEKSNLWHKIFASLLLADYAAYYTAQEYGLEAKQVPMVEEFKKLILE